MARQNEIQNALNVALFHFFSFAAFIGPNEFVNNYMSSLYQRHVYCGYSTLLQYSNNYHLFSKLEDHFVEW